MEQFIKANDIELCFESFGDKQNPCVLFVMGLGAQMIAWPPLYIQGLVDAGFHVVIYDNRDVGLSEKIEQAGMPDFDRLIKALIAGEKPEVAYDISDMANDGIALLDALGIEKAHVIGASMGGMIVQQMAIDHRHRLTSMTSIMSTTGDASVPQATAEAMAVLTQPPPQSNDLEILVDYALKNRRAIGGDGFSDDQAARALAAAIINRQSYPIGAARQRAGIMASGARTQALKLVTTPTLVIHGDKDPLVPVEGGKHTAEVIPGARLEILSGMGHAQFPQYQPRVLDLLLEFVCAHETELA